MAQNKQLPGLILENNVVLPLKLEEIKIGKEESILTIKKSNEFYNNELLLVSKKQATEKTISDAFSIAIFAKIVKILDETGNGINVVVETTKRVKLESRKVEKDGTILFEYSAIKEQIGSKTEVNSIRRALVEAFSNIDSLPFVVDEEEARLLDELSDQKFVDRFASLLPINKAEKMKVINTVKLSDRYKLIAKLFIDVAGENILSDEEKEVRDGVNERVKTKIQGQQKEFYLREQLRAIQAELDELTGNESEIATLLNRVESNPYPKHIKEKLVKEIKKLESTPAQAQEASITRSYIDWLLSLPYWEKDEEVIDIKKAKDTLDKDHFGLEKPKSKIIEFLAAKQQNPNAKGAILALVGPPGTGKTTMAKSIANSLGRKFVKVSLGGVKDESEIRGHRRTYIASMPGKIIQAMKKAGVTNPVILLDEIDKMSSDYKGDPSSAMLEVLDYEQNNMFQDHYIEEEYDLSNVMFIATANYFRDIPEALIDRMDIVELSSYTENEKVNIFKKHILPRVKEDTKIPAALFKWNDAAIKELIRHYTIEAGVRQLQRETTTIARKILVKYLGGELNVKEIKITPEYINELLGPQMFDYTKIDKEPQLGAVTGLAWTQYGGDVLPIEVVLYPGKGDLILTGQLKDVMRESASIALSYLKMNAEKFGIKDELFKDYDFHVHSPDGATPKDGPSAGVTFTTAMLSALKGQKVSQYIGMTGEITLRGNVLPIGGLKEKSISANRSGLKEIFIPKENIKDLIEIPKEVKDKLIITPVETYEEIYKRLFK